MTIRVASKPLRARIKGGSARSVGRNANIRLDASNSLDPNTNSNPDSASTPSGYTSTSQWICLTVAPISLLPCGLPDSVDMTSSVLDFSSSLLLAGRTYQFTYNWTVTSSSAGSRWDAASANITVNPLPIPTVSIDGPSVLNPGRPLRLSANVTASSNGNQGNEMYTWTETSSSLALDGNTLLSKPNGRNLVIRPEEITSGRNLIFDLTVTVGGGPPGKAVLEIRVNSAPSGGVLHVSPTVGTSLGTEFVLNTTGWSDSDTPMMYRFAIDGPKVQFLTDGQASPITTLSSLPVGNQTVLSYAIDSLGAVSMPATAAVSVLSPVSSSEEGTCFAYQRSNQQIPGLLSLGQVDEALGYIRVMTGLIRDDESSTSSASSNCAPIPTAGGPSPSDDGISQSNKTVVQQETLAVLSASLFKSLELAESSPNSAEQVSEILEEITTNSEQNNAQVVSNTEKIASTILQTAKPSLRDGSTTVNNLAGSLNYLLSSSSCDHFERIANLTVRLASVSARALVPGESWQNLTFSMFSSISIKYGGEGSSELGERNGGGAPLVTVPQGSLGADRDVSLVRINPTASQACHPVYPSGGSSSASSSNTTTTSNNGFLSQPFRVSVSYDGAKESVSGLETPLVFQSTIVATEAVPACKFWDTQALVWSEYGCTTTVSPESYRIGDTVEVTCRCDHLTEFAVIERQQDNVEIPESVMYIFIVLSVFYIVLGLFLGSQLLRIMYWADDLKDQINTKIIYSLLIVVCTFRTVLCFIYSRKFDDFNATPGLVLAFLASVPYCLICWAFAFLVFQWGAVFHLSVRQLRAATFKNYGTYYIRACTAASICYAAVFFIVVGLRKEIDSTTTQALLIFGAAVVAAVSIAIAIGFVVYGTLTGQHLARKSTKPGIGHKMIACAWTFGISFLLESVLWIVTVSTSGVVSGQQEYVLAVAYFMNLITLTMIMVLFETTIRVLRSRTLASRTASAGSGSSRGGSGSNRSPSNTNGTRSASANSNSRSKQRSIQYMNQTKLTGTAVNAAYGSKFRINSSIGGRWNNVKGTQRGGEVSAINMRQLQGTNVSTDFAGVAGRQTLSPAARMSIGPDSGADDVGSRRSSHTPSALTPRALSTCGSDSPMLSGEIDSKDNSKVDDQSSRANSRRRRETRVSRSSGLKSDIDGDPNVDGKFIGNTTV
eukprot:CAMPEP_0197524136 /NCGR_PEP_ID=MMETSP1318-20131121/8889_1 /TAXON_ID=552666 /ORGANISM="Partenskyella glossopodia, Strain RCC365" /LENGTH=1173 /DNA_ID=CAMNT_0043077019 /DNA_START=339 /DNA_END=3860 /DNA_ORIENTATION=+